VQDSALRSTVARKAGFVSQRESSREPEEIVDEIEIGWALSDGDEERFFG